MWLLLLGIAIGVVATLATAAVAVCIIDGPVNYPSKDPLAGVRLGRRWGEP